MKNTTSGMRILVKNTTSEIFFMLQKYRTIKKGRTYQEEEDLLPPHPVELGDVPLHGRHLRFDENIVHPIPTVIHGAKPRLPAKKVDPVIYFHKNSEAETNLM